MAPPTRNRMGGAARGESGYHKPTYPNPDVKIVIDFAPFVKAIQDVQKNMAVWMERMYEKKLNKQGLSRGTAPTRLGPPTDI